MYKEENNKAGCTLTFGGQCTNRKLSMEDMQYDDSPFKILLIQTNFDYSLNIALKIIYETIFCEIQALNFIFKYLQIILIRIPFFLFRKNNTYIQKISQFYATLPISRFTQHREFRHGVSFPQASGKHIKKKRKDVSFVFVEQEYLE